ncbi:MAG: hypothetical protein A2916_02880 [Candidatus Yanofskybacteria bacterium RIFCSPLOWO2_01_FULL_41_67]|nr:MAG: hypothetical protein A2916_02880 [Candidatus Yanofskybacteria bacterium RIFCSPLOWO2_01_FULL_41_67]
MQQLNKIFLVVIVVALGALGTAIYFYVQYSDSQAQVTQLIDEKTRVETEFAILRASDLAKDNELLKLKLKNTEQDLAGAQSRVKTLETNLSKIGPFLDVVSAIERFLSAPFTQKGLTDIDIKISVLQDMEALNRWMIARGTVDFANNGWGPHDFFQTVFLLNSRIKSLLP